MISETIFIHVVAQRAQRVRKLTIYFIVVLVVVGTDAMPNIRAHILCYS